MQRRIAVHFLTEWGVKAAVSFAVGNVLASKLKSSIQAFDENAENLVHDYELYYLFEQLSAYRQVHDPSFCEALANADRLVHLRSLLMSVNIRPTLQDRPLAFGYYVTCQDSLAELVNHAKATKSAKTTVQMFSLCRKIRGRLDDSWLNVLRMTNDVE